jgi:hypothetical protein
MKSYINALAAAALVAIAAPAFAGQIKASPGVTLTEAAQAKFNHDTGDGDDRHVKPIPGSSEPSRQFYASAGLTIGEGRSLSIDQVHVAKINREARTDEQQRLVVGEPVAMATRAYGQGGDYAQLAASAGLTPAEAAGMSLSEIAAVKFARESDDN